MIELELLVIVRTLVVGAGIPLATLLLTQWWPSAPSWLKALSPMVLVPLVTWASTLLSEWLGVPVDLSDIIDIISAAGMGASATVAYSLGKRKERIKIKGHA